jgi:hypothetical protein
MILFFGDIKIIDGTNTLDFVKYEVNIISSVILTDISNKELIRFNPSIALGHHQWKEAPLCNIEGQ